MEKVLARLEAAAKGPRWEMVRVYLLAFLDAVTETDDDPPDTDDS